VPTSETKPNGENKTPEVKNITMPEAEYLELRQKAEKAAEYWDRILRMQAEFENSRKRWERDKQEFLRFAQEDILSGILSLVDDFERSLKATPTKCEDLPNFIKGIEMMFVHFQELMKKHGVTPMLAKGKLFDPNYHEALMVVENDDVPEHTVLEELQKGYLLHNRVLRIAKVQISRKKTSLSEPLASESEKAKDSSESEIKK